MGNRDPNYKILIPQQHRSQAKAMRMRGLRRQEPEGRGSPNIWNTKHHNGAIIANGYVTASFIGLGLGTTSAYKTSPL